MARSRTLDETVDQPGQYFVSNKQTIAPDTGTSQLAGRTGSDPPGTNHTLKFFFSASASGGRIGNKSIMTDEASGKGSYNACTHTKWEWDSPAYTSKMVGESTEYLGKLCRSVAWPYCGMPPSNLEQGLTTMTPVYWDSEYTAKSRAIQKMRFGIQDAGFNMPVFAGELRDFRDVYSVAQKKLAFKEGSPYHAREALAKRMMGGSFLDGLRTIASADLFVQFALKPLISDIKGMLAFGEHMQVQWDRLNGMTPVRVRGTVVDRGNTTLSQSGDSPWQIEREHTRITTAWAMVKYSMENAPQPPPLLASADALGFDKPISTIWELLPWSFAIDYFVQVGDWLDQFQGDFIEVPYEIVQQGTSVKTTTDVIGSIEYWKNYASGKYVSVSGPPRREGRVKYTKYQRTPEVLSGYVPPLTPRVKLPNLRQVTNLLDIVFLKLTQ